jgi:hypothetical protein
LVGAFYHYSANAGFDKIYFSLKIFVSFKQTYWFVKLQKILNLYRSRSVLTRFIRILIVIDLVRRFYQRKNPEKCLTMLQAQLEEKEHDIAELKKQISEVEKLVADKSATTNCS